MCNKLVETHISSAISHKIIVDMYTRKPEINENNEMVFKKSKFILFAAILIIANCSIIAIFLNDLIIQIMNESNIDNNMVDTLYICGYSLMALFILFGIKLVIMFFFHEIIVSKEAITSKKMFSIRTIKVFNIETVTFSNAKGLVFEGDNTKVTFAKFTTGLTEILKFLDENIPKSKCETAIAKAEKMLRKNRIIL